MMNKPCSGKFLLFMVGVVLWGCSSHTPNPDKPHHTADGFVNLHNYPKRGALDFWKWRWERLKKEIPGPEAYDFPLVDNDPSFLRANQEQTTLTWIGHASVLLQTAGKNILTDPVFSERASPVQWAGPKRVAPPGLALDELPPIDLVVISHDHYDALDKNTVLRLFQRPGGQKTVFLVPLKLKAWFEELGIQQVIELDWWQQVEAAGFTVTAVPVQHWSKRSLFGRNQTLWAGWAIVTKDFRFFFTGDSGYTPHFKEIGERLGPFDLAAIPIGAYEPRWFMRPHHVNPEEAVQVHLDIRSQKSVAIHWGTFILSDEPLDEPPRKLAQAKREKMLADDAFLVLKHGETIVLD